MNSRAESTVLCERQSSRSQPSERLLTNHSMSDFFSSRTPEADREGVRIIARPTTSVQPAALLAFFHNWPYLRQPAVFLPSSSCSIF